GLVEGLLLLARADSDDQLPQRSPLDLVEIVRAVTGELAELAEEHGVGVRVALPERDEASVVTGDPEAIARVLCNLVDNAIRYNEPGGWVEIALRPGEHGEEIVVSDSGPGIASEHRARIFERFYRVDDARSRSARTDGGAGLGLAICRGIVDAHGGSIELGAHEGPGATFIMRLPRAG
ncbi:MAG: ATP-binding protein, partial [Planctomycetota bacterium]|nr:ATP-binding protein [Planctomycetota bacterium]